MATNNDLFSRNELYWGNEAQKRLIESSVAVFGLGGVGGFCAEALARAGIGKLTIIDFDTVSVSNINRQLIALHSTVNQKKTELFAKRLKDINPDIELKVINEFYSENNLKEMHFSLFNDIDYIADAIDTMRSKVSLLKLCVKNNIPVISSMGAGNRIDPTKLYISDISEIENKNAPFISNIIYQLKKLGIEKGITVVASREKPVCLEKISSTEKVIIHNGEELEFTKITPASTPFVASTAGIFMAYHIVNHLIGEKR